MHCTLKNRQGIIDAYLRDQLNEKEMDKFEAHYFECKECFNELHFTNEMVKLIQSEGQELLKSSPAGTRKSGFWEKLLQNISGKIVAIGSGITGWYNGANLNPAFAVAGATVIALVCLVSYRQLTLAPLDVYVYQDHVPLEYQADAKRGFLNDHQDPLEQFFNNRFTNAMIEYNSRRYKNALVILDGLQMSVAKLQENQENIASKDKVRYNHIIATLNDYYFYRGLVQLALARHGDKKRMKVDKKQLMTRAIADLQTATGINPDGEYQLDSSSEYFFLALGYAFQNESIKSRQILQRIQPGQEFYKKSKQLMNKLGDN